jgi:hypothetical protein
MPATDRERRPRFYFALPRLLLRLAGGSSARTEQNWVEANIAGGAIHLILFLFVAHELLSGRVFWQQLALLLPVLVIWFVFWLIYLYLGSKLVSLLRVSMPPDRAQGVLIAIVTSACAWRLLQAGGLLRVVGAVWLCVVCANVVAAGLLTLLGDGNAERLP